MHRVRDHLCVACSCLCTQCAGARGECSVPCACFAFPPSRLRRLRVQRPQSGEEHANLPVQLATVALRNALRRPQCRPAGSRIDVLVHAGRQQPACLDHVACEPDGRHANSKTCISGARRRMMQRTLRTARCRPGWRHIVKTVQLKRRGASASHLWSSFGRNLQFFAHNLRTDLVQLARCSDDSNAPSSHTATMASPREVMARATT